MGRQAGGSNSNMVPQCDHHYEFLRSEEQNVGYDRAPEYKITDLFFCTRCLCYRRIPVRLEKPDRDNPGRRVVTERLAPP